MAFTSSANGKQAALGPAGRRGLNRRTVLRGLGVAVALPPLEAMMDGRGLFYGRARAQAAAKRLIVLHWPQGVPTGWAPSTSGPFFPKDEGPNWTLTECLMPLAPHKADINLLSGLTYRMINASFGDPHGHQTALFTGYKSIAANRGGGASVDQIAARKIGVGTKISSMASCLLASSGPGIWSGPGTRVPEERSPLVLFDRVFGGAGTTGGTGTAAADAARRQKSVLDVIKRDIDRLNRQLGAGDRKRLDEHLSTIRELEKAVTIRPTVDIGSCKSPAKPTTDYGTKDDALAPQYADTMFKLHVLAHKCDLTRVSFINIGHVWQIYPFLEVETDYHNVCHDGFNDAASRGPRLDRTSAAAAYRKIARWHMEMVGKLLGYLKENDGTGALLDQTAFVATTEFGDGGLHYDSYVPFIVAGKAGRGADGMKTGFNYQFRCEFGESFKNASWCSTKPAPANRAINDVWQSALMAVGALGAGEKFGDPALPTKPLEGLWV